MKVTQKFLLEYIYNFTHSHFNINKSILFSIRTNSNKKSIMVEESLNNYSQEESRKRPLEDEGYDRQTKRYNAGGNRKNFH